MDQIRRCAQHFHVLADPIRLQILLLLKEQEMCVGALADVLGVNQPTVSYHLKRLHKAGLIERRAENTWNYYSVCTDLRSWVNSEIDDLLKAEPNH
ncbi:MAG TPA: winged helix-turn-helix transcriptional regulator [Firmicutes bacterium]|jgi:DNA-binding transcriptional ArsR family regulator|nr:winged helix-turn-helix transcriptional regulator [Bacillota bacterium]